MRNSKTKKLLAFILAAITLVGSALPVFAADAADDAGTSVALQELGDEHTLMNYESYKSKYNYSEADRAEGIEVTVKATEYLKDEAYTTAEIKEDKLDDVECIVVGNEGKVSWEIDVPETGWYCVKIVYRSTTDVTTDIERVFMINGKAPFQEA